MTPRSVHILPYNVREASPEDYAAYNRHINRARAERLPDDPPVPLEETIQSLRHLPAFIDVPAWMGWNAGQTEIVASGTIILMDMPDNQHLAQMELVVEPEYRRQGLGRRLLAQLVEAARARGRRLLLTHTVDRIPGGEAFMTRIGGHKGLEAHVNQLRIADLDHGLLERWLAQAAERAPGFELGMWDGPYPDDQIEAIAQLSSLVNQQPLGDLEIGDMTMTPEQLRQTEAHLFARGSQRWTFYVVEKATGKFAGYTETIWNPNRPETLHQEMTAVSPQYRNHGLGRWLKAAMLDKILKERPEVKFVRTGNADSNTAMLKINTALGFRPYMASALWQVEIDRVREYLDTDRN